jgi:ribosomal protein S18 acetylase RimI-like enzyme
MKSAAPSSTSAIAADPRFASSGLLRPTRAPSDLREIVDLLQAAFSHGEALGPNTLSELRSMRLMLPMLVLSSWLGDDADNLFSGFVWERNGRIVGNVSVRRSQEGAGTWMISNLAVHLDSRGKGVARRLMEAAQEHARERGDSTAILKVKARNRPAQSLYRSLGYRRYGREAKLRRAPEAGGIGPSPSTCRVRRSGVRSEPRIAEAWEVVGRELGVPHLVRCALPRPSSGLLDGLVRRGERWDAERDGGPIAELRSTRSWLPPFKRQMVLVPAPICSPLDARTLVGAALEELEEGWKGEVELTIASCGEMELEPALGELGFVEVDVEDSLWLSLRR